MIETKNYAKGARHGNWKGDSVGYDALHSWVKREFGRPSVCESCHKSGLSGAAIHWANKSGLYTRERSDWMRLCASCHRKYDMTQEIKNKISQSKAGVPNPLKWKPVMQTSITGEIVARYKNLEEAYQKTGISKTSINNNIKNRSKTAGGFIWTYL